MAFAIIDVRPHRGGWQSFESPGVQPYFTEGDAKTYATDYAEQRLMSRQGVVRVWSPDGKLERIIEVKPLAQRI